MSVALPPVSAAFVDRVAAVVPSAIGDESLEFERRSAFGGWRFGIPRSEAVDFGKGAVDFGADAVDHGHVGQFLAAADVTGAILIWIGAIERYGAGLLLGGKKPALARLGEAYRLVAMRPGLWIHGYDAQRGLKARLASGTVED